MQFSVNYSLELAELLRDRRVEVDRIKCADWPDMIATARQLRPIYVHFPLDAGSPTGRPANWARADAMARETDTPYVNLHLVGYRRDFPDDDDARQTVAVIDQMLADVAAAVAVIGRERVILENIPYFGPAGEFHRASVDVDVINRVVRETGCGFLLDISHARIAAHYLGVDPLAYVEKLPVDQLAELHITGVREHNARLADHMDLRDDDDWRWAEHAIQKVRAGDWATPWTLALEYGGIGEAFRWRSDKAILAEQVPRLYEMVKR